MKLDKYIVKIQDEGIRNGVAGIVKDKLMWFENCPPSLSGKYHGKEATMELHSYRCCQVAEHLSRTFNLSSLDTDILYAACILHDIGKSLIQKKGKCDEAGWKYYEATDWSARVSDLDAHALFSSIVISRNMFPHAREIQELVEIHMCHWVKSCPQPSGRLQDLMVVCDYIASRDNIELKE